MKKSGYISPVIESREIELKGLLCVSRNETSDENEMVEENEGYW